MTLAMFKKKKSSLQKPTTVEETELATTTADANDGSSRNDALLQPQQNSSISLLSSEDSDLFVDKQNVDNDISKHDCPAIVNHTKYPIVVFLARGFFFNETVLQPNEALICTRKQTGGLPYRVHAVIGNEDSLPTKRDSWRNLAKLSVVPAAFVAGCLITAASAGTLTGPSLALSQLVSGMVVQGVVIDAAAIAGGTLAADMAQKTATKLIEEKESLFCGKTRVFLPGRRYLSITGGLEEGDLTITEISRRKFRKLEIDKKKVPLLIALAREKRQSQNEQAMLTIQEQQQEE